MYVMYGKKFYLGVQTMPVVCRFKFHEGLDRETIETRMALAIVAAECVFGQAKVRISAGYYVTYDSQTEGSDGYQVAIDVSTDVGEFIAQVFTGLIIRQLGEDKFTVDRIGSEEQFKGTGNNERR